MKFKITHTTEYRYDSAVFFEPHYFRFQLRETAYLTRDSHELAILAEPAGRRQLRDEENNAIEFCWFSGTMDTLTIRSETLFSVREYNPLAFILHPASFNELPFAYTETQALLLSASLRAIDLPEQLVAYGREIRVAYSSNTVAYLLALAQQIHEEFTVVYREVGPPLPAAQTFGGKEGSCRDLSWMMIALLRDQGIAARFASGYFYFEMDEPAYELHAWVEVFLPGSGWLGLDPSHGMLAGNTHFPIASSAYPENTMPVTGGVRGSAASTLSASLLITPL